MPEISATYLDRIRSQRSLHIPLGEGTIHPAYDGLSLLNLPSSLSAWLKAGALSHPPMQITELDALNEDTNQIVLVLIDALSLRRFQIWMDDLKPAARKHFEQGLLFPLTSVVPSTTSAALTTLWTGRSPAEHGFLGYELLLKTYGLVANMITFNPASFEVEPGAFSRTGFDPAQLLSAKRLVHHLAKHDVQTHAFLSREIVDSTLSRLHLPGIKRHAFRDVDDLWNQARGLAEGSFSGKRLIWIYYGAIDHYSHIQGPDAEEVRTRFVNFMQRMSDLFIRPFSPESKAHSRLLILADHGQIATPHNPHFDLNHHPGLTDRLHLLPTGENRLAYLYPRPGQAEAVTEYLERTWPGAFQVLDSAYLVDAGLFGPGTPHPQARSRIGDRIALARRDSYLWWAGKPNPLLGRHGGLSEDEMLVPLYALQLD